VTRKCECCRKCSFAVPSDGDRTFPQPNRLDPIRDVLGLLLELANYYDALDADETGTTALEFLAWLQPELNRDWVKWVTSDNMFSRPSGR
jgi:hypothetical protein